MLNLDDVFLHSWTLPPPMALHDLDSSTSCLMFENQRQCLESASNVSQSFYRFSLNHPACAFGALSSCDEEKCPRTYSNGLRGRICDPTCKDGNPYGTKGCGAKGGQFGDLCRVCHIDENKALKNDGRVHRAIMYVK